MEIGVDRNWRRWKSGEVKSIYWSTFEGIALELGMDPDGLLSQLTREFSSLSEQADEIDATLLEVVRSLTDLEPRTVARTYVDIVRSELIEIRLTVEEFMELLLDNSTVAEVAESIPDPELVIEIDRDFSNIVFRGSGGASLHVKDAELLWDCSCAMRGEEEKQRCKIHRHLHANQIVRGFGKGLSELRWNGLRFLWRNNESLWPPSIDSFLLIEALQSDAVRLEKTERVLDLGSGTGFLGIAAAMLGPKVKSVTLSDWLMLPALHGAVNWSLNASRLNGAQRRTELGLFNNWIHKPSESPDAFDLVICNPPYLPLLPGFESMGRHLVVAGTELLQFAIENAAALGSRVLLQCSHLALPEANAAADRAGVALVSVFDEPRRVPFRVRSVFENPEYLSALMTDRGLEEVQDDHGHRYWHRLHTFMIAR